MLTLPAVDGLTRDLVGDGSLDDCGEVAVAGIPDAEL